jgi:hypothetical protein
MIASRPVDGKHHRSSQRLLKPQVPNTDCWAQRAAYPWTEQDELHEAVGNT